MKNIIKLSFFFAFSVILVSCSPKAKKTLGLANSGPNEYSVTKNKPLDMPPHFDLKKIEMRVEEKLSSPEAGNFNPGEKALLKALDRK